MWVSLSNNIKGIPTNGHFYDCCLYIFVSVFVFVPYTSKPFQHIFLKQDLPMALEFPCLVCCKTFSNHYKAVSCNKCNKWVHKACSNINTSTYWKLQKCKTPWYCKSCIMKSIPFSEIIDDTLKKLF